MFESIHYDQRYASLLDVYRFRSYTQAASKLGLTASAVAQQTRSIEKEIGAVLFRRHGRQLEPTRECHLIIRRIEQIEALCQKMSDDIEISKKRQNHLVVGLTSGVGNYAFAGMVQRMANLVAPMKMTVYEGSTEQICQMLQGYTLDIAVVEGSCAMDGLSEVILDTDHLSVAVPVDSSYAQKQMIQPDELLREPLVLKPSKSSTRYIFEGALKSAGISPNALNILMEVQNTDTLIRLVSEGYGLSVLSSKVCSKAASLGKISYVPLSGISMSRCVRILYRKDGVSSDILREMQRCYNEAMRAEGGVTFP